MHPLIAALALHHPHHHGNAAVQAFHQFGIVTHHGSGEVMFWAVVVVLVLIWLAAMAGRSSRRRAQRHP